jgi:RHS repeat-associated protein
LVFSNLLMNNSLPSTQPILGFAGVHNSSMEALALRQDINSGLSANTYVPAASQLGYKIFYTTQANLANVKSQLVLWNQNAVPLLTAQELISQHGSLAFGNWSGDAWMRLFPGNGAGFIAGVLRGGSNTQLDTINSITGSILGGPRKPKPRPGETVGDPVDVFSGAFTLNKTDLSLGSGSFPYTLPFEPRYDSSNAFNDGALGLGWTHNYNWNLAVSSDGYKGLGDDSPIEAAAAIVSILATTDIANTFTAGYTTVAAAAIALSEYWLIGQLAQNTVVLKTPTTEEVFYLLPDGTYHSPLGLTGTLTLSGGLYSYKTPDQVTYNFNNTGALATIVYPFGVTVTLNYTAGVLTSVTNGMGRTLTLNYTSGRLTSVTDGTGRSVSYSVDVNKNLTQFTDANGKLTTFAYGLPGQMTQMFAPQNPASTLFTNVYDSLGRIQTQSDALNNQSVYRFAGARTQQTDPVGNNKSWYFNRFGDIVAAIDALGNQITRIYDGRRRLTSTTYPEGNSLSYTYDNLNNVLTSTAAPKPGSLLANIVNVFTYDATYNKVHTAQDGRNNVTTYNSDPATGNLLTIQRPLIGGQTPTVTYTYNGRGQVLTRTDETNIVTQYNYDVATEKLLSTVVDFGIAPHLNLTTQYGYNTVGDVTSIIDPRSNTTTFLVDALRRTYQKTDPAPFNYVTQWTYDFNSQPTMVQRQTGIVGNPWQTTSITYSLSGKRKTITDPNGNVFTLNYDLADRLSQMTDAQGRAYAIVYDARNKVYTITDPTNTVAETRTYTVNGRLFQLTDARQNVTTFSYDGFDRNDKETFQDGTFLENQVYDANSNILTVATRSGNTIINTFDVLNRLATRTPQTQPQVTLSYDLAGRLTKGNKPTVAGDPSTGDFQFFYDTAGRAYMEQYPDGKTVTHVLDNNGNVTKTTYPDTYFVDRIYDQLNRLTDIKLNGAGGASAVNLQYDQLSRRQTMTLSNGVVTSFGFDLADEAASLTHTFNGSNVSFTYAYNKVQQLTSQSVSDNLFVWHSAAAGNTAYGAANNVNQYPTIGGVTQSYNTNGCLTGDGTWTYGYDIENHLLSATKAGVSASYVYDPMHRQAQKVVGAAKTRFIYSGWQRLADYDGVAGTLQNRYVYGDGLDDPMIQVSSAGVVSFFHQERQGSVVALTNSTGVVTNRYGYSPFGENATMTGTSIGFQGQRYDAETGLYYFKARHYSPATGRFLQPDVIGYFGGINLYAFVGNDPLRLKDTYGLAAVGLVGVTPTTVLVPGNPGPLVQPPMPEPVALDPDPGVAIPDQIIPYIFFPGRKGEGEKSKEDKPTRPEIYKSDSKPTSGSNSQDKDKKKGSDEKKDKRNSDNWPDPESEKRLAKAIEDAQRARDIRDGAKDSMHDWEGDLTADDRRVMRQKINELSKSEFDNWMNGKYLNPRTN